MCLHWGSKLSFRVVSARAVAAGCALSSLPCSASSPSASGFQAFLRHRETLGRA